MARILFIDDDVATLLLMEKAAEMLGHLAILSSSPEEAFDIAVQQKPDLILVDQQMQDMDGCNLIENLRQQAGLAAIPVYLVSAYLSDTEQERARQVGASGLLHKPVSLASLAGIVQHNHNPKPLAR
jgi:CheY-like chemotaxis protein